MSALLSLDVSQICPISGLLSPPVVQDKSLAGVCWKYLPDVQIGLDTHLDDFKKYLLHLVRPEWNPNKLASKVFDAGVTNALFAIFDTDKGLKQSGEDVLLLRINGNGTEQLINRTDEVVSLVTLHRNGLSPPVYGQLKNGLCYGFMTGSSISEADVRDRTMMKKIAKAMVQLHSLDIPSLFHGREPQVWRKSKEWLKVVPHKFDDPVKNKCFVKNIGSIEELERELYEMKLVLSKSRSPIVFCHNDLYCGNLIYNKDEERVGIIDFEYAGPNHVAYEIADHFCEFAGIKDVDYDQYPDEDFQKRWITHYLKESASLRGDDPDSVTQDAVHELYRDVNKFALSCHLFWTVWALFQALHSVIDFDYIEYAGVRYKEYKRRKMAFLALHLSSP